MDIDREIEKLDYGVIENIITEYYDMGYANNSSFPVEFPENSSGTYSLSCTKGFGEFSISTAKKVNGKYQLTVSARKIKRK